MALKPSPVDKVRSRAWTFTLNNYTPEEVEICKDIATVYTVFGKEVGPKCGTPHLQGYFYLANAVTGLTMRKKVNRGIFFKSEGSPKQNQKYCSKDATDVFTKGTLPKQGKRTDITAVHEAIKDGAEDWELWENHFPVLWKSNGALDRYRQAVIRPRDPNHPWTVVWVWGDAGLGKTAYAVDTLGYAQEDVYLKADGKWFSGYIGQKVFVLDDFDEHTMNTKVLLKLMDRYPFTGEVKGGFVNINSELMIITSDKPPASFWAAGNDLAQVMRRITEVIHLE